MPNSIYLDYKNVWPIDLHSGDKRSIDPHAIDIGRFERVSSSPYSIFVQPLKPRKSLLSLTGSTGMLTMF
jgi:hypothetical protein